MAKKEKELENPPSENPNNQDENKPPEPEIADGLVVMFKGGEKIAVHPTTVKSHEQAGWQVQK